MIFNFRDSWELWRRRVDYAISHGGTGDVSSVKVGETEYDPIDGVVNLPAYPTVPTNVSAFTNDAGYTTNTGTVTQVKVGDSEYDPTSGVVSLPAYPTVPTNVSAFTNDAGYTTNTGTVTQVKVGTSEYDPTSGVVSLPAYPTVPTNVSAFTNDAGYTTNTGTVTQVKVGASEYDPTSGVVSLPAYPTVPTNISAFTNDAGYTTNAGTVTQVDIGSDPYTPDASGKISLPAYPSGAANDGQLTIQKNGTTVQTFTANQSSNVIADITVPTKVSELTNDSGYTTNTGTVTQVKVGSSEYDPTSGVVSLPAYPTVPTNVSAFTNDAGYTTNTGTVTQVKVGTSEYDPTSGVVSLPAYPTVNNATLTIQKNGTNVQTFTANQSSNATANIIVPTKVSELTNDSGYTTNTGTVTQVKIGTTAYNPSSGVVSLPAYPTVNNGTLTIQKNGVNVTTFSANQSGNATANLSIPVFTYYNGTKSNIAITGPGHVSVDVVTLPTNSGYIVSDVNVNSGTGFCVLTGWHVSANHLYAEVSNVGNSADTISVFADGFTF